MSRIKIERKTRTYVDRGTEITLPEVYHELEESSIAATRETLAPYPKAANMYETLLEDPEVRADWDMADYIAVTKLSYNDHGEVHAKVATASAVKMLQLLVDAGIEPDVVNSGAGDLDDAFLVVATSTLLHDLGNQVHRQEHAHWGVYLAIPILDRLLSEIYEDLEQRVELRSFILHGIHCHSQKPKPLTIEGALVAAGDGTDLTKGRGRNAFDLGNINIHSVSSLSIDEVWIAASEDPENVPIEIVVLMSNSAGIFQVQDTLTDKVINGPLDGRISIIAATQPEKPPADLRIVHRICLKGHDFVCT